jgi:hypothetical protein
MSRRRNGLSPEPDRQERKLQGYPRRIGQRRDHSIRHIGKELNDVLYERPAEEFAYLEDKVKLDCPTMDKIDRIAEAKASRDVLIHNRGVVT